MRRHFNKSLIMSVEEEERFEQSNICSICNELFDLSDHCYINGKYRGAAHWSCNINLKITKNVPVIFHNSKGYDGYLMLKESGKYNNMKISVIPNGLEKYMAFTVNKNLFFLDSMQFMNASLDSLVKCLTSEDVKYLNEEFSDEYLKLVKDKGYLSL